MNTVLGPPTIDHNDETSCSLLQGMFALIGNQVGADDIFFNAMERSPSETHSQTKPKPALPYASVEVSKLLREFPADAFEPVPIGPNRVITPAALGTSLLEGALDKALGALNDPTPCMSNDNKDEVLKFSDISVPAKSLFDPLHIQADEITSSPSLEDLFPVKDPPLISEQAFSLSFIGGKQPLSHSRTSAIPPTPKRRRTTELGVPTLQKYQEEQWMEQFNELLKFKERHGHCLVPHTYSENQVLARWVKRQRYQYKLKKAGKVSTMTEARINQLEDTGFVWDSHAVTWNKRFRELQEYREKHGDCNVPSNYPLNQDLAVWVKCQRRQYKLFWSSTKSSSMTFDRMGKLNELGFIWKMRDDPPLMVNREHFQWDHAIS